MVASAAVDLSFEQKTVVGSRIVHVKEKWKVMTSRPPLIEALKPYADVHGVSDGAFVKGFGCFAKGSALDPPLLAKIMWSELAPSEAAIFKDEPDTLHSLLPVVAGDWWCRLCSRVIGPDERCNLCSICHRLCLRVADSDADIAGHSKDDPAISASESATLMA